MSDQEYERTFRFLYDLLIQEAPRQHRLRTPECPSLLRLSGMSTEPLTVLETEHANACAYCQKVFSMGRAQKPDRDLQIEARSCPTDSLAHSRRLGQLADVNEGINTPHSSDPEDFRRHGIMASARKDSPPVSCNRLVRWGKLLKWMCIGLLALEASRFYFVQEMISVFAIFCVLFPLGAAVYLLFSVLYSAWMWALGWAEFRVWMLLRNLETNERECSSASAIVKSIRYWIIRGLANVFAN